MYHSYLPPDSHVLVTSIVDCENVNVFDGDGRK